MKKITLLIMVTFFSALSYSQTVDCAVGPVNNTGFCYGNNDTTSFTYTSSDGSPLAVTFNAGQVENNWDELIITDSDGTTQIYSGYGAGGDLTGLSFESTGDTITIGITSDGSVNCTSSGYTPWDFTISCVDTTLPPSCVSVTSPIDGATDVDENEDITWGTATGGPLGYLITIGTTPGGSDVVNALDVGLVNTYDPGTLAYGTTFYVTITPYNANGNATGCVESSFTSRPDPNVVVDCASGVPVNVTGFCYENNNTEVFNFASSDGSTLQIVFNSGNVENNWDELIITDSDGVTELYNGYGNNGDLAGLIFESSGPSLSLTVTSDGSVSCVSSAGIQPWDYTVSCVDPSLPPGCVSLTSPVDGATDINEEEDISWTTAAGNPTGYLVSIGTTPGGTDVLNGFDVGLVNTYDPGTLAFSTQHYVTITPYNANGNAVGCPEESFTTRDDPFVPVDCNGAPLNVTGFCYTNNDTTTFSYTSSDGTSTLALLFNAGQVENNWDELIVFDSDGTEIYNGYGNGGDLAGLSFESSGGTITFQIQSDGVFSCQSQGYTPWDFTIGCIDPTAPPSCVSLISPVDGATAVEIDENITWGSAIGSPAGYILTVGTTPGGNDVEDGIDVGNVNTYLLDTDYDTTYYVTILAYNGNGLATGCTEESFTTRPDPNQVFNLVCADGPIDVTHCYTNNDDNTFLFTSDSGFPVRLTFTTGTIVDDDDIITFYDGSDNTFPVLFSGNNAGDLTGLVIESNGGNLFMEVISDGFTSCAAGNGTTWEWTAECLTCFKPTATYSVIEDCAEGDQFLVDVEITNTGDAESISIFDDFGSASQVITDPGIYTFGPYPNGTPVVFTVADTDDTNCVLTSDPQTQAFCPDQACRIINAGYDQVQDCDQTSTDLSATFMASSITTDTSTYTISDLQCPPDNLTGEPTSITLDDRWSSAIDLEFEFEYFGNSYNSVIIGANGLLSFQTGDAGTFCPWNIDGGVDIIPSPTLPLNAIHGAYHDIDPSVDGDHYIEYAIVGTAPSRQFKITFFEVPHFSAACNDLLTTQQIILYESSNVIDVLILEKPVCTTWNQGLATLGIQNITGTVGYAPPGRNTGVWDVTTQELWRFVPDGAPNYTFEWLDEDGNVISNDTDITVSPTEDTTYTASITYALADGSLVTLTDDVTVRVQRNPEIVATETLKACDDDFDGIAEYDLTLQDEFVTGTQTNVTVTYYETMADAEAGTNVLADPAAYTSGTGTVYVRIEDNNTGCYATGEFQIELLPQIDPANISLEGECINDEYTITVSPLNNAYDPATVTYEWSGGASVDNDGSQFVATEDGEYTVIITTADGCASMQTFTVINAMCSFPQGISPNGDGLNDTLDLRAFKVEEIEIFNSHGRSLYKKVKYTNEWAGQTNDNDNLPVGTYFYVLRLENGQSKNGWIYLNK